MRSRFLNFGDDIHDHQLVRERITSAIQRISTPTFDFCLSQPRLVDDSQLCHFSSSERAD